MDTFTSAYDGKIRPLMDKIDQVRSILSGAIDGVSFPTVVVVGDQSSGKSTLLESLSLVELPKGDGVVTRCPLVLRLRKCSERRVYHLHENNEKTLLDESVLNILEYIEEETKKLAGVNKNVVKELIELQVEDPNVRDLTVVDLPGITRNPLADQPKDIHSQTTNLIRHFIRQEGSVILCVFPANVDVATVESFTLAREVDPLGIRTIGVITKSDLAPNVDVLCQQLLMEKMEVLQLKLGFVAVRNRRADENMTLKDARNREMEFFKNHVASTVVGWHSLGINALINRLADLYADRVKETFPKMRAEIQSKMIVIRGQLMKFPPELETASARLAKYHELAEFYVENILKAQLNDDCHVSLVNLLHEEFNKLEKIVTLITNLLHSAQYRTKVVSAMSACSGEQLPNFLPHPLLKRLIHENVDLLWCASNTLVKVCFNKTKKLLINNGSDLSKDNLFFTKLQPAFRNVFLSFMNDQQQGVHDQLYGLVRLEKQEPYTMNHYYMDRINSSKSKTRQKDNVYGYVDGYVDGSVKASVSNDDQAVDEMLLSVSSYWAVIRKRFMDYTALAIRSGCVFDVSAGIRERLRRVPAEQCDFVDANLGEDAHVRAKRQKLQIAHDKLAKVLDILGGQNVSGKTDVLFTESENEENGWDELMNILEQEDVEQDSDSDLYSNGFEF